MKSVERNARRYKLCVSFNLFILCTLLLTSCALAECGDCDDKNPCTKDTCVNGTRCEHTPQICDRSDSAPASASRTEANANDEAIQTPIAAQESPTPIATAQDSPATVAPAQDNPETVAPAQDNPETVAPAQDNPETVAPAQDNQETVAPAQDNQETAATAQDNQETVAPAQDNQETVAPAQDNQETAATAQDNPETVAPAQDNPETAATTSQENPETIDAAQENSAPNVTATENTASDPNYQDNPAPETLPSSEQIIPETFVSESAANGSVSCDDNNPCTHDSLGENGCIHDAINCDDGNDSTVDTCSPSGCINTPLCNVCGNSVSVPSPSPTQPDNGLNETAQENGTNVAINEPSIVPFCDDSNPCTTEFLNGTSCVYVSMDCNDGNDSTRDFCSGGVCFNEPIGYVNVPGENNSAEVLENNTENNTLADSRIRDCDDHNPCTEDYFNGTGCEHKLKDCDDGNDSTHDYCYAGECYHTTRNCDDGNNCTIDSFNGKECVNTPMDCDDGNACTIDTCDNGKCVHTPKNCDDGKACTYDRCDPKTGCYHPSKCDDGDPCTIDYCDSVWGCYHSPVVCSNGKTCINGVCQYPYYDYVAPYVAPTSTTSSPQSYTIPAGTAVTLPWGQSITALGALQVNNGLAYPGTSPLRFARLLGYENQATSAIQIGSVQSTAEQAEMIGLSWKDVSFSLTLIQPDGTALPAVGDGQNVVHVAGNNYDYYFLKNAGKGNWYIDIKPINPTSNGAAYSLISGQVKGTLPANQV